MGDSDRISLMLDSMLTAVDEGFSFDGIVSVPKTGLEDIVYRPGLVGLLRDSLDLFRKAANSLRNRIPHKEPTEPEEVDKDIGPEPSLSPSPRDSGISSTRKSTELPSPSKDQAPIAEGASDADPQVSPQSADEEKLPRKRRSGDCFEEDVRDDSQSCDTVENDLSDNSHQKKHPRKRSAGDEVLASRDPRKKHGEEGLAPNVGHSGTEIQPRKKQ